MKRGIFMTFVIVLMFLSLIIYTFEMSNAYKSRRIIHEYNSHISRISYVADDLSTDLSDIYGVKYSNALVQNFTVQTFRTIRLQRALSQQFSDYFAYVNATYPDILHANLSISTNLSNTNITCNDGLFMFKNHTSNETYLYANASKIYNATIELYVNSSFAGGTPWTEIPNETSVYLRVASLNGTDVDNVYSLRKTINNDYVLNYTDGLLHVEFGDVGIGAEGIYVWGAPSFDANLTTVMQASDSNSTECYFSNSSFSFIQPVVNETASLPVVSSPQ